MIKPITFEYIRRFSILVLLSLFAWMFFYTPPYIYQIQLKDYAATYQDKIERGWIDPSTTSLEQYIARKMKGPYSWSNRDRIIVDVEGESGKFLKYLVDETRGQTTDAFFRDHRSPDKFWSGNSFYFRSSELPGGFLSKIIVHNPDYLRIKDSTGEKHYFRCYEIKSISRLDDAPLFIKYPLRKYSLFLLLISALIYFLLPRIKVPKGGAYYTRFNAVYLPDVMAFVLWIGVFVLFNAPDDSLPMAVRYFFLFFGILPLTFVLITVKYASSWYLFKDNYFQYSGRGGFHKIPLQDIISVKPYTRRLPKWIAPLIMIFGRGNPGSTGLAVLSSISTSEIGMEITTKSGEKIKVMANYLKSDKAFTECFQQLENRIKET